MNNYVVTPEEALHYTAVLFNYVEKGVLNATVYKEYPFTADGVKQAHSDLTAGTTTGKLVLKV
jgi:NADPH2:quinone reductase